MAKRMVNLDTKDIKVILDCLPEHCCVALRKKLENNLRTIKVSSRKGKGRGFQQWVCSEISTITGVPYDQGDEQCEIHSKEMTLNGKDIVLRGLALERFPFSVECKNTESLDLYKTVMQAKGNQTAGTQYLIVHKRKSLPEPVVIMDWSAFSHIIGGTLERHTNSETV